MAEYIDLNNTEVLAEAGENAKLVVEEDGELKRIPASAVGQVKTVNGVEPDESGNVDVSGLPEGVPVIQSATVGQTVVVKAVDESGKPTEWEAVDVGDILPEGVGALHVTFTEESDTTAVADVDVSTIASALHNGRYVYATMMGDGFYVFTPISYVPDGLFEGVSAQASFGMQMVSNSRLLTFSAIMQNGTNVKLVYESNSFGGAS